MRRSLEAKPVNLRRRRLVVRALGYFVLTLAFAFVFACATMLKVDNPESKEFPCGPLGVVCSGDYPHASCCWEGDLCGSDEAGSSCPAGYCCFIGVGLSPSKRPQTPYREHR